MCMQYTNTETQKIGYCRVSTKEQDVRNQIKLLKEEGIDIIFSDEGISGMRTSKSRPEYKRMLKYIEEHPSVKFVYVFEISRLGRNMMETLGQFTEFEKNGINVISLTEDWTRNCDPNIRPLLVTVVSWINEQELVRMSTRIKAGLERAKAEGKKVTKPFKNIDEELVEKMHSEGLSYLKIAQKLNIDPSTLHRRKQLWKESRLGRSSS